MPKPAGFAPIEATAVYPLPEFQRRTGLGEAALRAARRNGLKLRYTSGRVFVVGSDFLEYVRECPTTAPQANGGQIS